MGTSWTEEVETGYKGKLFPHENSQAVAQGVQSLPLEVSEIHLDKALRDLVRSHSWPCFEQKVGPETSWGPFWPWRLYDFTYTLCLDATPRSSIHICILALCRISSELGLTVPIKGSLVHKLGFFVEVSVKNTQLEVLWNDCYMSIYLQSNLRKTCTYA